MALFSRKSKSKHSKGAEGLSKDSAKTDIKSNGRPKTLTKSQSTPVSRRNSLWHSSNAANVAQQVTQETAADPSFVVRNNDSPYPPILPVPNINTGGKVGVFVKNNAKAAKLLGMEYRSPQSTSSSRPSSSHNGRPFFGNHGSGSSDGSVDQKTVSRHDSFNSSGDTPRIGILSAEKSHMTFAEEIALEPAFSDTSSSSHQAATSQSPSEGAHSRQVSHDSFRPVPNRRHSSQYAVSNSGFPVAAHPAEHLQRARSQHQVPSYSMPTKTNRMSVHADMERTAAHRHADVPVVPPFPAAHQLRTSFYAREQSPGMSSPRIPFHTREPVSAMPSPLMRPQFAGINDDAVSIRSFQMSRPLSVHQTEPHPSNAILPPLSALDGLKVNRRGKLLDEEGDVIGELIEGELIDCVRQKANACGEVLDECGRVVGRVRTLTADIGISTPAMNVSSPAILNNSADYFNIQPQLHAQSPAMTPVLGPHTMQRRMQDDMILRYRTDAPPVPVMPAAYQAGLRSPMLGAHHKYAVAPLGQSDDAPRVELDGSCSIEPMEDIPVFDLSEPFMPTPKVSPVAEPAASKSELPTEAVTKTTQNTVEVSHGEHVQSNAASIISGSVQSSADDDEFVAAREQASSPIDKDSRSTSYASLHTIQSRRPSQVDAPAEDTLQTPREHGFSSATVEPVAKPEPVPAQRTTPTAPTKLFHRPGRDPVVAQQAIVKPAPQPQTKAMNDTQASAPVPLSSQPSSLVDQPITALRSNKEESKPAEPVFAPEPKSILIRPVPTTTVSAPADIPPLKSSLASSSRGQPRRRDAATPADSKSAPASIHASSEDSMSDSEGAEIATASRKEVRISAFPPTMIPARAGLSRALSDGAALSSSRFNAMPSVPESEPLLETQRKGAVLSPNAANNRPGPARAFSARAAPPLPSFPRQNFTGSGLPQNPFAAANAMNNNGAALKKRNSLPNRPGIPPMSARMAMNKSRYTTNAPLVSSPLSDHRKTLSTLTASTVSSIGSEFVSDRKQSDAISIYSTQSARSRTYFTHSGRVTVEAGDLPPSMQVKNDIQVTERPLSADGPRPEVKQQKKKGMFGLSFGKKSTAIAAH